MARRRASKQAASHRANSNRHGLSHPTTPPAASRRGNAQRMLLLGDDIDVGSYTSPRQSRAQEARNTEERNYRGHSDRKLRQMGITFVSPQDPPVADSQVGSQQSSPPSENTTSDTARPSIPNSSFDASLASAVGSETDNLPTDTQSIATPHKDPQTEPITPMRRSATDVSSPGEEVVFVPRNRRRNPAARTENQNPPSKTVLEQVTVQQNVIIETGSSKIEKTTISQTLHSESQNTSSGTPSPNTRRKTRRGVKVVDQDDEEAEIMNDYIQNLQENGEMGDGLFSLRLLGTQLPDLDDTEHQVTSSNPPLSDEGPTSDGSDTKSSDEPPWDVNTPVVIGKRYGDSGVEYLFKPAGSQVGEAIWLESGDMTHDIQHLIDHFEASLGDVDIHGWDRTQDDTVEMLREQQGQDEDEGFDLDDMINMMNGKQNKRGIFPNASKLADAYDDFDIMDRSRVSLMGPRQRKLRKRDIGYQLPPQFLDDGDMGMDEAEAEIDAELHKFIANDREKKRIRKQEREELRQAGLLGNKASKPGAMDFRSFSTNSSPVSQVHASITSFLMNGLAERLTLPPMPKAERVQIHVIAAKFYMTSKSQGKGDNRFPVLYKTKRTALFEGDEEAISDILTGVATRLARGRPVHNQEGSIVGTGAAEIGQGNKGYEMLAKMGWTTGTGLGSNRSGILDPVQAIIKSSRTGLG
ncbi:hypothetical protein ABW21_db0203266 [Orbilia brochopaga]|nr:hypothetical protein ABW21_db0203266 [Drechslerella brochopaga]